MSKMRKSVGKEDNKFFNINKLPNQPGICVFGISMPLIDKKQSPAKLFESSMNLLKKIRKPQVGDIIVYSDGLYMNSDESSSVLKNKFQRLMEEHKRGYQKLIEKNIFLIPSAFSFVTWSQLILNCLGFKDNLIKLKGIYKKDKTFLILLKY